MGDGEDSKSSANNAPVDGAVKPKPPDIVRKIEWILRYGKQHWGLVLVAVLIMSGGWLASMTSGLTFLKNTADLLVNRKIRRTVSDLRQQYRDADNQLSLVEAGNFSSAERDIKDILKLDPVNGHGLYFSGEVQRVSSPESLFTPKSCVLLDNLAKYSGTLDVYENAFLRYLDIEKSLQDEESKEDFNSETCYKHTSGYCGQRTAWINHLLANDLYAKATLSTDRATKKDLLQRALKYADASKKYRDENGTPGFIQCTPTAALISKINEAQAKLENTQS
jgi:hypothetical protein